jgi:transcriptional regulator with XRE-family HTH domain
MCNTLSERILKVMDAKEITQADLARMTGMTTSNVAYIVTGQTKDPRLHSLILIANALDVSLDYLAGLEREK